MEKISSEKKKDVPKSLFSLKGSQLASKLGDWAMQDQIYPQQSFLNKIQESNSKSFLIPTFNSNVFNDSITNIPAAEMPSISMGQHSLLSGANNIFNQYQNFKNANLQQQNSIRSNKIGGFLNP